MEEKDRIEELESALEIIKKQTYFQGQSTTMKDIERELKHLKKEEEIKSNYKTAYEKEFEKRDGWMTIGIFGIIFTIILFIFLLKGMDNLDMDDQVGPQLCAVNGYEFYSITYRIDGNLNNRITDLSVNCIKNNGKIVEVTKSEEKVRQIGNALCLMKYNKTFDGFDKGVLNCKNIEIELVEQYDGIKIKIN